MPNNDHYVYAVKLNGEEVFRGSTIDIAERFGLKAKSLNINRYIIGGYKMLGKYDFEYICKEKRKRNDGKPANKRFEEKLERVYVELCRSGVTCLSDRDKAEDFIPSLEAKGLKVWTRKGKEVSGKRNRVKYYDILEVE